ncbi:MAG: SdiA-regulated family protein, partial [Chitinophagaceae bacterium]
YEDLAITRENVFILKSNGTLFSFGFDHITEEEVDSVTEWKGVVPKGEYEAMSVDPSGNLVVICKKCAGEKNKELVSGYIIKAGDSLQAGGSFNIDVAQIKAISGKVKRGFRPSGLARNPVTGEWFIISSINKLLVVTDQNWKVTEACQLDGNMFNQPEGIAFDKQGNLYISNEGDDLSQGNILKFRRAG